MLPEPVLFNKVFGVIKENNEFFISERRDKRSLFPVFDLPNKNWCLVKKSKDDKWLILFYKKYHKESGGVGKESFSFYISFAKESHSNEVIFNTFREIEQGASDEAWMKRI